MAAVRDPDSVGPRDVRELGLAVRLCVSLATSAFFLAALFAGATRGQILDAFARVRPEWLTLALAGLAMAFAFRAQRWALMLRRYGARVRFRDAAVPLVGSAALNNLLPCGAGDAVRMIALQSFADRVTPRQLATLSLEKLLDVCAFAAIGLATLALVGTDLVGRDLVPTLDLLAVALTAAAILLLGADGRPFAEGSRRLRQALVPIDGLVTPHRSTLSRPAALVGLAGLSLGGWLAEGLTAFAAAEALSLGDGLRISALALTLGGLARFLPSLPGSFGAFDYFVAGAATALGAAKSAAVAYALLVHALLWIPTTVTGWLLLVGSGRLGVLRGPAPYPA